MCHHVLIGIVPNLVQLQKIREDVVPLFWINSSQHWLGQQRFFHLFIYFLMIYLWVLFASWASSFEKFSASLKVAHFFLLSGMRISVRTGHFQDFFSPHPKIWTPTKTTVRIPPTSTMHAHRTPSTPPIHTKLHTHFPNLPLGHWCEGWVLGDLLDAVLCHLATNTTDVEPSGIAISMHPEWNVFRG